MAAVPRASGARLGAAHRPVEKEKARYGHHHDLGALLREAASGLLPIG